jgi:hypothetical protein
MTAINHDLLQPSLQRTAPGRAPYSQTCGFACAFLGGPPSVLLLAVVNAFRLGRWVGFEWSLMHTGAGQAALAWSRDVLGARGGELLRRALALAFFAATALWLHGREHRMADLMGLQRPNGWRMGLLLIVAGNVLAFLLRVGMKVAE